MKHPLPEELFEAASDNDRSRFASHLDACSECRSAFVRLRAGASLLDEAAEEPEIDDIQWDRIDDAIRAEGDRVAAGIRAGTIRAPRPWGNYAVGGLALAAAAAAVIYVRTQHPAVSEAPVVAHRDVAPQRGPMVEGAVLLAAGGATLSGGERLSTGAALREGARIETTAAGRAVFTLRPTVTMDVRAGSDVTLTAMRDDESVLTLARGEVAVDREGSDGAVSVRAGRWSVGIEGDAVARVESHVVRVVVLSGRTTVEADGVSRMQYSGPIVIELPEADASRVVAGEATDGSHIDTSLLRAGGRMWALPALDGAATVSVRGGGPMPSSLEAIRVSQPVTLEARLGRMLMVLEVGTGEVLAWHAQPTVASAQPTVRRPTNGAPSVIQSPVVDEGPQLTPAQYNAATTATRSRFAHCFQRCLETNRCARDMHGVVELSVPASGRPTIATISPNAEGARRCLEDETSRLPMPNVGEAYPFQVRY